MLASSENQYFDTRFNGWGLVVIGIFKKADYKGFCGKTKVSRPQRYVSSQDVGATRKQLQTEIRSKEHYIAG
jgi:hypothetical protein